MGLLYASDRVQEVRLAGSGRGAAHVYADDRPGRGVEEDRRAAGETGSIGSVSDEHARHVT